jgi:hypothetical protein
VGSALAQPTSAGWPYKHTSPLQGNHTRRASRVLKGAIITGKAYRPPIKGGRIPTICYYPLPLSVTTNPTKNQKKQEKERKKEGKKGVTDVTNVTNVYKKFSQRKIPRKTFIFIPPDLLHSLQFVTFSGAASFSPEGQSDRTLSSYSVVELKHGGTTTLSY